MLKLWCRGIFMTLSLVWIHSEAQLQILKKPLLVLASFHDIFISQSLFIYLFPDSCSWWHIFGHLGEEAETDHLSCCTLLIRTIPSDLHLHRFNFAFESWINTLFLYLIAHCSVILWTNSTVALSVFPIVPERLFPLLVISIYFKETCRGYLVATTTSPNVHRFYQSTLVANGRSYE